MRTLMVLALWFLYSHSYGQTDTKPTAKPCRCEGNGACELKPRISELKSKKFNRVEVSKTNETAYNLVEKTRLIEEKLDITYTQGGCDHAFRKIAFASQSPQALTNYPFHLAAVSIVLEAVEEKKMLQAVKTLMEDLKAKKAIGSNQTNFCRAQSADKVTCLAGVASNFAWVEIVLQKQKGQVAYEVTLTEAI